MTDILPQEKWDTERWSDLPMVTERVRAKPDSNLGLSDSKVYPICQRICEEISTKKKKKKRLKKFLNAIQPSHYTFRLVPYTCMSDTFSVSSMSPKSKLSNSDGAAGGTVRRQHTIVTSTGSSFRTVTTSWWSSPSRVMPFTCAKRKVGQERRLPSRTTPFKAIFYYININCTQGMIIAVLCSELWLDL